MLTLTGLPVIGGKPILRGLSLEVPAGKRTSCWDAFCQEL